MLTRDAYIQLSLEYNLFWVRIMKEHALFILGALPSTEKQLYTRAGRFLLQYDNLLANTITAAGGAVSKEALESGQYYTNMTEEAERNAAQITGIDTKRSLTRQEYSIEPKNHNFANSLKKEQEVSILNQTIITQNISFAQLKTELLNLQSSCRMFSFLYTGLLKHILEEVKKYTEILLALQKRNEKAVNDYMNFWIDKMAEHAKAMRGLFDINEDKFFSLADEYALIFDEYRAGDRRLPGLILSENEETSSALSDTAHFSEFCALTTKRLTECKVKAIMLPLFTDHLTREANHFLYLLR